MAVCCRNSQHSARHLLLVSLSDCVRICAVFWVGLFCLESFCVLGFFGGLSFFYKGNYEMLKEEKHRVAS